MADGGLGYHPCDAPADLSNPHQAPRAYCRQSAGRLAGSYPNVWLGATVENRRWLHRLDTLCQVPAVVHFASFEPLLRALGDLTPWLSALEWVIVGGESGSPRRPLALAWLLHTWSSARPLACRRCQTGCRVQRWATGLHS